MRVRRSQVQPAPAPARRLRSQAGAVRLTPRRELPLWLWSVFPESHVVVVVLGGAVFGRVLASYPVRDARGREFDAPVFDAEVWPPGDPWRAEKLVGLSTSRVLRYVSDREALTMTEIPSDWLTDDERREPLPERVLRAIFDSPHNADL